MHPKHVLVVGATGFIGQALVKRLLASGHRVSALHRSRKPEGLEEAAWIGTGDLATTCLDPALGDGVDTVVALAARVRPAAAPATSGPSETESIARNLRDFVIAAGIRHVLVGSSIAARIAGTEPRNARGYGREKSAADRIFLSLPRESHKVVLLRPPAVYGPGMRNSMGTLARLVDKGMPLPLGSATAPRHYISLHNLVTLMEAMVASDAAAWSAAAGRAFEPSDGTPVSTRDLVRMMGDMTGRKARLVPFPLSWLRLAGAAAGRPELVSGAIDRLEAADDGSLERHFGWRPAERMPESLAFLAAEVRRA